MQKIDKLINKYDPFFFNALPKFIKRRADALRKLQYDKIQLELEYYKKLQALEFEFAKLYEPFNEKRAKIIKGEYEPTDDECKLPEGVDPRASAEADKSNENNEKETDADSFGDNEKIDKYKLTDEEESNLEKSLKGIPSFWLCVLLTSPNFNESIESYDKPILKHLQDITVHYEELPEDVALHTIIFHFAENPYFTNATLTKKYHLKLRPDPKDPFSFDGHELIKIEGCTIDWKPTMDVTSVMKNVKQKNKHNGEMRLKAKPHERDSFFHFFNPPQIPAPNDDDALEEEGLSGLATLDFELAEIIRLSIVPKAVLYYTGEIVEEPEEDEDFEEDSFDYVGDESSDDDEDDDDDDEDDDDDGEDGGEDEPMVK